MRSKDNGSYSTPLSSVSSFQPHCHWGWGAEASPPPLDFCCRLPAVPGLGQPLIPTTWLVSCCSRQQGTWLSCSPPSRELWPAKARLTLGSLQSGRLLLVTNEARRTEVRTNSTAEGSGGKERERKIKTENERKPL